MPMSDSGNLSRTRCSEAGVHIPHPSCGKLYCTTQQKDPDLVLAWHYWKHDGHTAWESFLTAQMLLSKYFLHSWPIVATPPSCLLCKNTAQWWKCKIHLSSKENKMWYFWGKKQKQIVTKQNFKLLNSLIPFVKQFKMTETESKCNMSLKVSFITLQFGSRLHAIKSKIDIS